MTSTTRYADGEMLQPGLDAPIPGWLDTRVFLDLFYALYLDVEARPATTAACRKRVVHDFELRAYQLHGEVHLAAFEKL